MLVTVLLVIFVATFFVHIVYLTLYVLLKEKKFLNRFLATFILNMVLMTTIMVVSVKTPGHVRKFNVGALIWLLSGLVFVVLSIIKIIILRRIYKRSRDPEYFHYNFFGRKVYNRGIIKKSEFFIIIGQMPFFLFMGAYFIGKLVNIILHGFRF